MYTHEGKKGKLVFVWTAHQIDAMDDGREVKDGPLAYSSICRVSHTFNNQTGNNRPPYEVLAF
jgi:hypothetical protein